MEDVRVSHGHVGMAAMEMDSGLYSNSTVRTETDSGPIQIKCKDKDAYKTAHSSWTAPQTLACEPCC